jgi:hypothetical protein
VFKYLISRGISTFIVKGTIAILVVVAGGGILTYQYYFIPKQEIKNPLEETSLTQSLITITSPQANSNVNFPLIVTGIIGPNWGRFEGTAGNAQLYFWVGSKMAGEWKQIGTPVSIIVDDWTAPTTNLHFTVNFNNSGLGLSNGTMMKIIFTEENASGLGTPETFELPVILSSVITQPLITIISPIGGETWQIGTNQTIKYSTNNIGGAGMYIDSFAIDSNGNKIPLTKGNYIGMQDALSFQLGSLYSQDIQPGQYKIQLNTYSNTNESITYAESIGYVTITANSNFTKPLITQITPNQGSENDTITILGNNLSSVFSVVIGPVGGDPLNSGWNAYTNIISKDQNSVTFTFNDAYGELPAGTYQVYVLSRPLNSDDTSHNYSNSLNFTFTE